MKKLLLIPSIFILCTSSFALEDINTKWQSKIDDKAWNTFYNQKAKRIQTQKTIEQSYEKNGYVIDRNKNEGYEGDFLDNYYDTIEFLVKTTIDDYIHFLPKTKYFLNNSHAFAVFPENNNHKSNMFGSTKGEGYFFEKNEYNQYLFKGLVRFSQGSIGLFGGSTNQSQILAFENAESAKYFKMGKVRIDNRTMIQDKRKKVHLIIDPVHGVALFKMKSNSGFSLFSSSERPSYQSVNFDYYPRKDIETQ